MEKKIKQHFFKTVLFGLILTNSMMLLGCASHKQPTANPVDPYEKFNRVVFKFNRKVDKVALRPIAKTYDTVTPAPARAGVRNFFRNIGEIPTVANDLLQADLYHATADTWRFVINSTLGLLGIVDVAKKIGLPHHYNDFGITLAKWGVRKSNYIMLPILGPSTLRDTLSYAAGYNATVYPYIKPIPRYSLHGLRLVERRAQFLQDDKLLDQAFDPYVFLRNAYLQHRKNQIMHALNEESEDPYIAAETEHKNKKTT